MTPSLMAPLDGASQKRLPDRTESQLPLRAAHGHRFFLFSLFLNSSCVLILEASVIFFSCTLCHSLDVATLPALSRSRRVPIRPFRARGRSRGPRSLGNVARGARGRQARRSRRARQQLISPDSQTPVRAFKVYVTLSCLVLLPTLPHSATLPNPRQPHRTSTAALITRTAFLFYNTSRAPKKTSWETSSEQRPKGCRR